MTIEQEKLIEKVVRDVGGMNNLTGMLHSCNRLSEVPEISGLPFSEVWERAGYYRGKLNDELA